MVDADAAILDLFSVYKNPRLLAVPVFYSDGRIDYRRTFASLKGKFSLCGFSTGILELIAPLTSVVPF